MAEKCPKCGADYWCDDEGNRHWKCETLRFPNGVVDESHNCLRHQLSQAKAEIERLKAIVDKLPSDVLLRYPAPFRVSRFVNTIEILDGNGSRCDIPHAVQQCLNICREAAEAAKEK